MGDEMLKVSLFGVTTVMLSAVISCNVIAKTEFRTLSFQGEIAEPSCYSDLSTISCYNQKSEKFISQDIHVEVLLSDMLNHDNKVFASKLGQINKLVIYRLDSNTSILSIIYN